MLISSNWRAFRPTIGVIKAGISHNIAQISHRGINHLGLIIAKLEKCVRFITVAISYVHSIWVLYLATMTKSLRNLKIGPGFQLFTQRHKHTTMKHILVNTRLILLRHTYMNSEICVQKYYHNVADVTVRVTEPQTDRIPKNSRNPEN
jgi:hypothetical protein